MILTCPKCAARYDVPDWAIPQKGRDVECSECGFGWRQSPLQDITVLPSDDGPAGPEAGVSPAPGPVEPAFERPQADETYPPPPHQRDTVAPPAASRMDWSGGVSEPDPRATLDPVVDEATENRRLAERGGLEAALYGGEPSTPAAPEISSTLPPTLPVAAMTPDVIAGQDRVSETDDNERQVAEMRRAFNEESAPSGRGGLLAGFLLALILVVAAVAVYLEHGRIAAALPETAPTLAIYVGWVDAVRAETVALGAKAVAAVSELIQ